MTQEQILFLFKRAIEIFYERDRKLVEIAAHERACVARIAIHLQQLLNNAPDAKKLCVDCEYGSMTTDTGEEFKKYMDANGAYGGNDGGYGRFFPDLIIHERGTQQNNLLVAEFKGYWHTGTWGQDQTKLEHLTKGAPSLNLKPYFYYRRGVFVALGRQQAHCIEFANGRQVSTSATIDELYKRKDAL